MKKLAICAMTAGLLAVNTMVIPAQAAVKVYVAGSNGIMGGGNWNDAQDMLGDILNPENCGPGGIFNPALPQNPHLPETPIQPELPNKPEAPDQPNADQVPGDQSFARQVFDLVNEERSKAGLSPLTYSDSVSQAAMTRAKEITRSFSHTRPGGKSFSTALDETGVSYRGAGENIAYGQQTPEAVMKDWMNSSGHRANILNGSYTAMGVGYYEVGGVGYWVQLFTY